MLCTNSERTVAAFCTDNEAYRCLHSLHDHVAAKLSGSGKKADSYRDVKAAMVTDWKHPAASKVK